MVRFDDKASQEGKKYIDDRTSGTGRRSSSSGGMSLGKSGGIGGILIALVAAFFGLNLGGGSSSGSGFDIGSSNFDSAQTADADAGASGVVDPDAEAKDYMAALMDDTQDVWADIFEGAGLNYQYTTMVIFEDQVSTNGCGNATSAVGPFYCPAPSDQNVYIDLAFFDELSSRFGAPGDFAQAYVIAHEVGHHIQSIAGISDEVAAAKSSNPSASNELSVRQELQADCFAGVWAYSAARRTNSDGTQIIEIGDLEEGLRAAEAVGDDSISEMVGAASNPHNWTHGSAEARKTWFLAGYNSGDAEACDTFAVSASEVGL